MVPLYASFSFSVNNRACQQLAKLLLLWRREEEVEEEVIEWGVRWLKPFLVLITQFRLSEGVSALMSPLYFLTLLVPVF